MLELVYRDTKLVVYKTNTYRGQEEDKWQVLKIIGHEDSNKKT